MGIKCLLVNPSQKLIYDRIGGLSQPHMGLAYLAAVLEKEGCSVRLTDMDYDKVSAEQIGKIVENEKIDLVGLTATTPVIKTALTVARAVKIFSPKTKIAIGGVHASVMAQQVILESAIDYVVRGEGEKVIKELVEVILGKKGPGEVLGITFKEKGEIIETPPHPLIENLDGIPFPARHLFSPKQYRYPNSLYYPAAAIHTSRGCPAECTFCQAQNMYGHRVRFRSATSVADEVELLIKKYGVRQIDVWDDNFAASKQRVLQIRDEIVKRDLKTHFSFNAGIRVDTACDAEVLKAMRDMGGFSIAFGIESGSQAILDKVQKRTTLGQAREATVLAKRLGFETWGFFIIGFPDDNEETMRETISFARELNLDIAHFHILKPYPGSQIYLEMMKENLIDNLDFENYGMYSFPVHHTKFVSSKRIFAYQKMAYRSFYLRPKAIINQFKAIRTKNRLISNLKSGMGILRFISSGKKLKETSYGL